MISSTAVDLPEYREALRGVCASLDLLPRMMEDLAAGPGSLDKSLAMVDEADIYVGLFAHRYGSIPTGETKSFTELELDRALDRKIEILNFLISEDQRILPKDVETGDGAEKLKALKERIKSLGKITNNFATVHSLQERARQSLTEAKDRLIQKTATDSVFSDTTAQRIEISATTEFDPKSGCFNVPFRSKGDGVIGRDGVLGKIHEVFQGDVLTPFGKLVALVGLGGLGKTQLAVEYAHRFRDEYPGGVVWLGANEDIDSQLITLSEESKWISPLSEHKTKLDVALNRIRSRSDCLIIFDNLEEFERIQQYLPRIEATPHLLLTSQREVPGVPSICVDFLDPANSLTLLVREAGNSPAAEHRPLLDEILDHLDGLPLALEMAGAFVRRLHFDWQTYLNHLKERPRRSLVGTSLGSFTNHDPDVFATLRVSEQVLDDEPHLRSAIDVLTWSGSADMGIGLLSSLVGCAESDLIPAMMTAVNVRLVRKHPTHQRYSLHRLLQLARRENAETRDFDAWQEQTGRKLGNWFEQRREDYADLAVFEAEFDHLAAWQLRSSSFSKELSAKLQWLQAYPPFHRGRNQQSHDLVAEAESILATSTGDHSELKAHILADLGFTYIGLGKYDMAVKLTQKALDIRCAVIGEEHPDTARAYGNLGATYNALGKYEEALELEQKALAIQRAINGEQHPDTARAYGNLGATYGALGKYEEALELRQKALQIQRTTRGEEHPDTARAYGNLGAAYGALGKYEEALELEQKALDLERATLGEDHPDTATCYGNLGVTYSALAQHDKALELKQKALDIRRAILGEEHPDTATAYGNVAVAFSALGQHCQARDLEQKALDILRATLGDDHPVTATAYGNLGITCGDLGKHDEALDLKQKALDIRCATMGEEHPDTATAYRNLGATYSSLRKHDKTLHLTQRAHGIYKNCLGIASETTRKCAIDVAITLGNLGRPVEAWAALREAVHDLPKAHPIYKKAQRVSKNLDRGETTHGSRFTPPKRPRKKKRR